MTGPDKARSEVFKQQEALAEMVTNALAERFQEVTGKRLSDKGIEALWYAIRFEAT